MKTIQTFEEIPSPIVCKLFDKEISIIDALYIRQQLTAIIDEVSGPVKSVQPKQP